MPELSELEIDQISFPVGIVSYDVEAIADMPATIEGQALVYFRYQGIPAAQVFIAADVPSRERDPRALASSLVTDELKRHISEVSASKAQTTSISVLICTRDRPDDLRKCLASLTGQSLTPLEIIVIDNASRDDRTRQVTLDAGATYVREDRPGLDFARNAAIRAAKGELVAYTDDDVVLHECWLENLAKAFDRPEIACVTGLVLPGELDTEAQFLFESRWGFGRGFKTLFFGPDYYQHYRSWGCPVWNIGAGASQAFRRDVFEKIGLFDVRLDVGAAGCCGDSELWNRLLFHGYTCRYEPSAVSWHFHRRDMEGLRKQIRAYMSGHVAALFVQYQRTKEIGNLLRMIGPLPKYYRKKLTKYILRGPTAYNVMLFAELKGCMDGLRFMLKHWRIPEVD